VALENLSAPEITAESSDVAVAILAGDDEVHLDTAGKPTVRVSGTLGAQMLVWETATAIAGRVIGINPFDQPDVESAKQAARGLLDASPESEPAQITESGVEVRGSAGLLDGVNSVADAVGALISRLDANGYIAVMAYVDAARDVSLHTVRPSLAERTGRPVTFGWGPRFLHSTGQYHKGGPPQGVFIQITCDEPRDVEIPERPFSFGTLIAAQAAGDAKVLAEHDRPVLRLHLTDLETGVAAIEGALR
jgi:glucose-6-phosphate isomerase